MPIRINLLAEAIADDDLRRRDPVKRAIYGGAFVVALSLVWYSSILLEYMVDKQKLSSIELQIQSHTNDFAVVESNKKRISDVTKRLNALDQLAAARFLQGNLMNALQQTYVPNVQLTKLRVDQNYSATAGIPAQTNSYGVVPGRPPVVTEHVTLAVDAKDYSANPGDQVPHFKDALLKQEYFNRELDATNGLRLSNESPLQASGEGKPYVIFTLECRFHDRKTP